MNLQQIKDGIAELQAKKEEFIKNLKDEFPKLFQPLFQESELIESVGWTQYTPYFNDGDACYFRVNGIEYCNGESEYDCLFLQKEIGDWGNRKPNPEFNPKELEIYKKFIEIHKSIPGDFYESLFGDHVMVTLHSDGRVEVDEYEHD